MAGLNQANNQLRNVNNSLNQMRSNVGAVSSAFNNLGNALNNISNLAKSIANGVNRVLNGIISGIRTALSAVRTAITSGANIISNMGKGVQKLISLFGNLGNRVKSAFGLGNSSINAFSGSATELLSKIRLLTGAFEGLFNNRFIEQGRNLLSSISTMNVIVGKELTQNTINWANSLERAFGLSASGLIVDMQQVLPIMYGLGMASDDALLASQNLAIAGRYLASLGLAGGDFDVVMSKISSGMRGMTTAIDDLGLSVREAQMNEFLKSLKAQGGEFANISTDFSALNEQARVYVRYAALINQLTSKYDLTNMVNMLDTTTGRISLMQSAFSNLTTTVGVGLTNAFAKLSTFLIPVINGINKLVEKIFAFFGISTQMTASANANADATKTLAGASGDLSDNMEKVAEETKKATANIQGFDRVSSLTSSKSGGAGGAGASAFDYSTLMNSAIGDLTSLAESAELSFAEKVANEAKTSIDMIFDYIKKVSGVDDLSFGFDIEGASEGVKRAVNGIKTTLRSLGDTALFVGTNMLNDLQFGALLSKSIELIGSFSEMAGKISLVLQPAFERFYEVGLAPTVEKIGTELLSDLDELGIKFDDLGVWFETHKDEIVKFFEDLGVSVNKGLSELGTALTGNYSAPADASAWSGVLSVINGVSNVIQALIPVIAKLGESFADWLVNEGLPKLAEWLDKLAVYIENNGDKIQALVERLGNLAWDIIVTAVESIGEFLDKLINNESVVNHVLTAVEGLVGLFKEMEDPIGTIIGLKIGAWFIGLAADLVSFIGLVVGLPKAIGLAKTLLGGGSLVGGAASGGAALAGAGAAAKGLSYTLNPIGNPAMYAATNALGSKLGIVTTASKLNAFGTMVTGGASTVGGAVVNALPHMAIAGALGFGAGAGIGGIANGLMTGDTSHLVSERTWTDDIDDARAYKSVLTELHQEFQNVAAIAGNSYLNTTTITSDLMSLVRENLETLKSDVGVKGEEIASSIYSIYQKAYAENRALTDKEVQEINKLLSDAKTTAVKTLVEEASERDTILKNMAATEKDDRLLQCQSALEIAAKERDETIRLADEAYASQKAINLKKLEDNEITKAEYDEIMAGWEETQRHLTKTAEEEWKKQKGELTSYYNVSEDYFGDNGKLRSVFGSFFTSLGKKISTAWNELWGLTDATSTNTRKVTKSDLLKDDVNTPITSNLWAARITSHAGGGSINGGNLFIANENGKPELIGSIGSAPGTQVANNSMIIEAMTRGVQAGTYGALAQYRNAIGGVGGGANINIGSKDGFVLLDEGNISQLVQALAPYFNNVKTNIFNTDFSI